MSCLVTCVNRRILIVDDTPSIHDDFRNTFDPTTNPENGWASAVSHSWNTIDVYRIFNVNRSAV
jgi:hypothetical protein